MENSLTLNLQLTQCQMAKLARLGRTSGKSADSVALSFLQKGVRHPRRLFSARGVSATRKETK